MQEHFLFDKDNKGTWNTGCDALGIKGHHGLLLDWAWGGGKAPSECIGVMSSDRVLAGDCSYPLIKCEVDFHYSSYGVEVRYSGKCLASYQVEQERKDLRFSGGRHAGYEYSFPPGFLATRIQAQQKAEILLFEWLNGQYSALMSKGFSLINVESR